MIKTSLRILKEEHLDTLISIVNLIATYRNQGRWDEVKKVKELVVEMSKRVIRAYH